MLPSVARRGLWSAGRAGFVRLIFIIIALLVATVFLLHSLGPNETTKQAANGRLETVEAERTAAALRAAPVVAQAARARAATKPALARSESLRARVWVERAGQLRVEDNRGEVTLVPVPPLVTDRIQTDSVLVDALSVALMWDGRAAAAREEQLAAEAKVRDVAHLTIEALERERRPRCGRRCGLVLGAASVVALGIAVDQTRRLLHP